MTRVASSRSCTSTTWCGARSSCEYCLAAPTRLDIAADRVLDLAHEQLGFDRVGDPAHGRLEVAGPTAVSTSLSHGDVDAAGDQRGREVPGADDAVRLEPVADRVLGVVGLHRAASLGAVAARLTAVSCSSTRRASGGRRAGRRRSCASLCRMPATRSRSTEVARTAAAAGLLSSWVSPADSAPSASSRSRSPTSVWLFRMPKKRPSSMCIAIGNQRCIAPAKSSAGSA